MRPQLVHLHDPELLLWAPMWKAAGIRVVYDMHENLSGSVRTKSWIPGLLRSAMSRLVRVIERSLASRCAVVFAEESYVKEHPWVKRYAVVLNMPIADELLRVVGRPPVEFTVGYAGLISQSRGSLLTLEALARLRDDGVGVCWQVAGRFSPPGHEAEIRRRVAELRLTEQVTFHGPVMPREAWKLMADCHCGLAVLRPEPNYLESYPTKLFEYMALGLPVVASDFPLYRRVVQEGKCGICVAPDDGEALARALRTLYNDPGRCWRMGAAGKQAVATRYNWANEEKKLLALYEVVLDSGRAGRS
jgi:glycosyltransferase involved in cell wall biosynthesis